MFIYLILNLRNLKLYVGKTERSLIIRWQNHTANARMGTDSYLYRAIRKYGEDSFVILKLDVAQTSDELAEKEINWISELDTRNPKHGYNMTDGGEGVLGWIHTEETRQKMKIARSKYNHPSEVYAKVSAANKGKKRTPETIAKMKERHKKNPVVFTIEIREKMRLAKLGKKRPPRTPEHCENIRKAKMGHTVSPEARAKISATLKARNKQLAMAAGAE